jgi:hypothetical protein
MSRACSVCGNINNNDSSFCENCGVPLFEEKSKDQNIPTIAVGHASYINEEKEKKDSMMILDATSLFSQENHRRIWSIIIAGSVGLVDAQIMNDLLQGLLQSQKTDEDIQVRLSHAYEQLIKSASDASLEETEKNAETGLLISIIDNKQFLFTCTGTPHVVILDDGGIKNPSEETKPNQSPQANIMEAGDFICMSSSDVFSMIGEKETTEIILKAENPQTACDDLLAKVLEKENGASFSIILIQFVPNAS